MSLNKILVVIDPTQDEQAAFERGLDSAHLTGARLHLYVCLEGDGQRRKSEGARMDFLLESYVDRCEADGVVAYTEIDYADNWSKQVVTAAARCSASMIFKSSFTHDDEERQLRPTSDWTLMRLAPCPILMVKNVGDWKQRRVLAAIDCQSTDDAHIKLNNQIISFAQSFTDAYGSDAHFVNAYQDKNLRPDPAELARTCGTPLEHVHVVEDTPAAAIGKIAEELSVDLIIIGTVGRTGIKARTIGNTSERILDHTQADVLVLS
jgi:universal stress protein E